MSEKKVTITCTEKQLALLDMVCDRYSRLICGQLGYSLQDICEDAWEKYREKQGYTNIIGSPEWYEMRAKLEERLKDFKRDYWKLSGAIYYGVGYDKKADALFDMHQCMRYARYLNMPKDKQEHLRMTVMADAPMRFGELPLIDVKYVLQDPEKRQD